MNICQCYKSKKQTTLRCTYKSLPGSRFCGMHATCDAPFIKGVTENSHVKTTSTNVGYKKNDVETQLDNLDERIKNYKKNDNQSHFDIRDNDNESGNMTFQSYMDRIINEGKSNREGVESRKKEAAAPKSVHKKPVYRKYINQSKVTLRLGKADANYLRELKYKLDAHENETYSIDKFENDINDDNFIKTAINAHVTALEFKLKRYKKLSLVSWQDVDDSRPNAPAEIDINKLILRMIAKIETQLSQKMTLEDKRYDLMSILYDEDNGLTTIRGKSRSQVRTSVIKMIYMFIKVPDFFFKGFINYMLTGSAGSGKTKIATVLGFVMKNLGILVTKKIIMTTRQNLVAGYVGQSAFKTKSVLANTLEGVVFIDEAYTLTQCPDSEAKPDGFAEEAVGELVNFIDKFMGCIVVIVAGYKEKMHRCFLAFNEGMSRRFNKNIDLIPYSTDDLYEIFETFLSDSLDIDLMLSESQLSLIKGIIAVLDNHQVFNNQAGDMLNLSKDLAESIVLDDNFNEDTIKLMFEKFCAQKNMAIDFGMSLR